MSRGSFLFNEMAYVNQHGNGKYAEYLAHTSEEERILHKWWARMYSIKEKYAYTPDKDKINFLHKEFPVPGFQPFDPLVWLGEERERQRQAAAAKKELESTLTQNGHLEHG